jgi:predicted CXXCH cytochrome family protein
MMSGAKLTIDAKSLGKCLKKSIKFKNFKHLVLALKLIINNSIFKIIFIDTSTKMRSKVMKNVVIIFLTVVLMLSFINPTVAQIQTARIIVKGITPDVMALGRYNAVSSGLPNVGKGEKVWLEAQALFTTGTVNNSWIDTIITESWTLTNPPGGSAIIVHSDTTTYFIPDTTGQYIVDLSVTTSHGTKTTSIYINSGKWVGVGRINGKPTFPQCALCHGDKEATWKLTNHATAFQRKIDDAAGHFGSNCVSCHSVGYNVLPSAFNNGFDDVKSATGWIFPAILKPGNYDSMKVNYPALVQLTSIQCENCHGPGSTHYGQIDQNQIAVSLSSEVCGQCHGKKYTHSKNYEWESTSHAKSKGEPGSIEHMNSTSCAQCHTAQGYITENLGHGASGAPYNDVQSVTCAACHDPHMGGNPGQLRVASVGEACTSCHKTRISSRGLHHSNQGPLLAGVTGTPFTLGQTGVGTWGGFQFPGYQYQNSSHSNIAGKCADCHMASIAGADTLLIPGVPYSTYRGKLGGHTFKVAYDNGTPDDATDDILNPVGCKDCHGTVSLEFVEQSQAKIKALLEQLRVLLPHATSGDTTQPKPHTDASLSNSQKGAAYNYYFTSYDGSYGVHNYEYTAGLLRSSIEMVKLGAGAADISSIKDIPNDQGKQVQIVWNKFPAESDPVSPVINYLVLRQDSVGVILGKSVVATSFREMLLKVANGSSVSLNGSVWTKVGEYKALKLAKYSLNVPTLFDSTVAGGQKLTTFEVVGYTATNVVYTSAPATGYSVDNLVPAAPGGLTISIVAPAVKLEWQRTDTDVNYYAIYRGTTPGFNFEATTPVGTTTGVVFVDNSVGEGNHYYYVVRGFDFSGNKGETSSADINFLLGVNDQNGIPTEFALMQNYPNPFNPTTNIKYQVPEAGNVSITIYNYLGQEILTLMNRYQDIGYYTIQWNGKDKSGNPVNSGIYIYKMKAGTYSSVKKMLLVK